MAVYFENNTEGTDRPLLRGRKFRNFGVTSGGMGS